MAFGSLGASTLSKFAWVDELKSHIERCWRVPAGFDGSSGLEIRVTFELNRDGTLARDPVASTISRPHPMGAVVAKSVVDAIKRCQPYSFLPAEQYTNGWDNLEITFTITPTAATDPGQDGPSWLRDSAKQELRKQKSNKDTGN